MEKLELYRDYRCRLCGEYLFRGSEHYGSWSKAKRAMIFYCDRCYEKNKDKWKERYEKAQDTIINREAEQFLGKCPAREYFIKKET